MHADTMQLHMHTECAMRRMQRATPRRAMLPDSGVCQCAIKHHAMPIEILEIVMFEV